VSGVSYVFCWAAETPPLRPTRNNRHSHLSSFIVAHYPPSYFNQWVQTSLKPSVCLHSLSAFHGSHVGLAMVVLPGRLFGNKEMRLLMLGLDAAGKTSKDVFLNSLTWVILIVALQRSYTNSSSTNLSQRFQPVRVQDKPANSPILTH
jgi:hypothetical protein